MTGTTHPLSLLVLNVDITNWHHVPIEKVIDRHKSAPGKQVFYFEDELSKKHIENALSNRGYLLAATYEPLCPQYSMVYELTHKMSLGEILALDGSLFIEIEPTF